MSGDKRARLKQWLDSGEITLQSLTFPQRELWEASPVPVGDMANHICCLIHIRGTIAAEDSRSAIQRVVERQDALRVSFLPGKDRPVQMVRRSGEASFRYAELSATDATAEGVEARAREVFREPFDMVQGPLYRVEMMKRGTDEYVLAFAIHHAIADGWTLGVFVQDLCAAYLQGVRGGGGPLPKVPQTVAEWGAAERAYWQPADLEKRVAFWKPYLAGSRRIWKSANLPKDAPFALERWVSHIPLDLANAVRELAKRTGTTLFSTLLAAFQATLSRWSGEDDITVGSPVANRNKQSTRETMGYYAGVVPLRGKVSKDRSFSDGVKSLQQTTVDAFANAMPFVELMRAGGDAPAPGHHPLFDIRFALQNHPIPDVDLPGLSARLRMRSTGTARFHLGCELTEMNDGIEVAWLFRPALMPQSELENLNRLYQTFLAAACRSPEGRIGALSA